MAVYKGKAGFKADLSNALRKAIERKKQQAKDKEK